MFRLSAEIFNAEIESLIKNVGTKLTLEVPGYKQTF
jgi:hypothetical protein